MGIRSPDPFGVVLKRAREQAGLTQEELASRAGLSAQSISTIERGTRRRPHQRTIQQLADALELRGADRQRFELARGVEPEVEGSPPPLDLPPLPVASTPFVDREREARTARLLLRDQSVRLITLTGPGGVGKSRLALEAATEARSSFADGAALIRLAPLSQPGQLAAFVAEYFHLSLEGAPPVGERLLAFLQPRELLVILDNFEHLLDAASWLASVLSSCPRLKLLVTSRAPLRLSGEYELAVAPLALPPRELRVPNADIRSFPAVDLFVRRVRAVRPSFELSGATASTVVEICRRLDGLPLALELVAARARVYSLDALLARLSDVGGLLAVASQGPRDLPGRQQTLRATIQWSYVLLGEVEQRLFRRLAVFQGGFTAADVVAVTRDASTEAGEKELAALTEHSLVVVAEDRDAEPRFDLLETIRAFASEQLVLNGEADDARQRHAEHYLELAEALAPPLSTSFGDAPTGAINRISAELPNLRAALTWLDERDPPLALRLIRAIGLFWRHRAWIWSGRGSAGELRSWLESVLQHLTPDQPTDRLIRFDILLSAAAYAGDSGNLAEGRRYLDEAKSLLDGIEGVPSARSLSARVGLNEAIRFSGDLNASRRAVEEYLEAARESGNRRGIGWAFIHLADVEVLDGNFEEGRARVEAALAEFAARGDDWSTRIATLRLAWLDVAVGKVEGAYETLREFGAKITSPSEPIDLGLILMSRAAVASTLENLAEARTLLGQGVALFQEAGNATIYEAIAVAGDLLIREKEPAAGVRLFAAAETGRLPGGAIHRRNVFRRALAAVWTASLQRARIALGEAEFTRNWELGRKLTVPEAIGEARLAE